MEQEKICNTKAYCSMDELPPILTVKDVKQFLRVGRNTAYELVRSGQIPSIKVGRQYRIPKQTFAEYSGQSNH